MAWALWGYHPDSITELLAAGWPLLLLLSLLLLGRGGSRQTIILAVAAITPIVLLVFVALYDRELFEVRYFLVAIPLLFLLIARLVTGWIRRPEARLAAVGIILFTLFARACSTSRPTTTTRACTTSGRDRADPGRRQRRESLVLYEPPDMRYVMEYYAPELRSRPLRQGIPKRREGTRSSCSPPSRTTTCSSTGPTGWSASSTSSAGCSRVRDAADEGLGVPMSSRPWDVRLRRVTWQPVPSNVSVRPAFASWPLLGLPLAVWYFGWLLNPDRIGTPYLYGLLIAAELFNMIQAFGFWWTCASERVRKPKAPSQRVAVDVFVPVYKEPVDIVDLTVAAAAGLRGAEVRVWVLDDGNDDAMRDLAARYGVGYIRRDEHTGAKAGNINNALTLTDAPFIAVFDSDHVADPSFLEATLGLHGGPRGRVRPDAAVLREPRPEPRRRGVLVPAGPVLRRDRQRQGRPRRRLLLRHQRAVPPRGVRERRRLPDELAHRGLRAVDLAPRGGLEVGLRAGRAVARPRPGGHGRLRVPAAALGAWMPVRPPARAAGAAAAEAQDRSTCCPPRTSCRGGRC